MDFQHFVEWSFYGIMGTCAVAIARSIMDLNVKIAVVIEQLAGHEKRIERLEELRHAKNSR